MANLTALAAGHGFTAGDLNTSGQIAGQAARQKYYFCDGRPYSATIGDSGYHKLDFINTRIIGTVGVSTFEQGEVVTSASSAGIFDENVGSGATAWSLIYRTSTTEFAAGEVITGADSGATVTPADAAKIIAPPHWLNWTLTTGSFPDGGSNIMSLCWGRIFLNSVSHPHQWTGSRVDDPLDILLVTDDVASAVNSQATKKLGLVGDQLVALIPFKGKYQIYGCLNAMFVMRADPARGAFFSTLADNTGIFSNTSYCWDSKYNLYWLGNDGIYVVDPKTIIEGGVPINLTTDRLPKLMKDIGLNRRTDRVSMEYDKDRYGIKIDVTQFDGAWNASFFLDLRTGGIFPDTYADDHMIHSLYYLDARKKSERKILAGCQDGYIRTWDEATKSDDGSVAIDSQVFIGPVSSDQTRMKVELEELSVRTGIDTDRLTIALYSAITSAKLISDILDGTAVPRVSKTFIIDKLLPSIRQKVSDGAIGIMLSNNTAASSWSSEKIDADMTETGRIK